MERRDLGQTGIQLPVVGVGARRSFDVFGKEGQSSRRSLVDVALSENANFFETSPEYGEADGILASSLTGRRQRAIVAASISSHDTRLAHSQIDRALRLFEEQIDILFVEHPDDWVSFEPAFKQMKSDGSIRAAGISCARTEDYGTLAEVLATHAIDAIQIPYHPAAPEAARDILPLAVQRGVGIIANQPFNGGELLDVAISERSLARFERFGVNTPPQAILKWILSDQRVSAVIPGTRRVRHLRDNLKVSNPPWLGQTERDLIVGHFMHQSDRVE